MRRRLQWLREVAAVTGCQSELVDLHVELLHEADGAIAYEIYSQAAASGTDMRVAHGRGRAVLGANGDRPVVDLAGIKARCVKRSESAVNFYAALATLGISHASSAQVVTGLFAGANEAGCGQLLVELALPSGVAATADKYVLHPSVLDGALQASAFLRSGVAEPPGAPSSPISVDEVMVYSSCPVQGWGWIRSRGGDVAGEMPGKLDIDRAIDGRCSRLRGLVEAALAIACRRGPGGGEH